MPTYDSQITRSKAGALIPEDYVNSIIGELPGQSSVMRLGLRLQNAARNQLRVPVWQNLPTAYFVSGDTGLKQTTDYSWENVYANIVELACIVPIPEAVLEDSEYDIMEEAKPGIVEAFGQIIDLAVFHGTNKPAEWTFTDVCAQSLAASHTVDLSTAVGAGGTFYTAVLGETGTVSMVENDGLMVNGHVAAMSVKGKLRGLVGSDGHPVFVPDPTGQGPSMLAGAPLIFPTNGGITPASALMISGDFKKIAWTLRKDMTYKVLDQAVIQDNAGNIIYNLAQQDMVALRVTMRMGVAMPNPPNRINTDSATRCPFAVLVP